MLVDVSPIGPDAVGQPTILGVRFAGRKETDVAADLARLLREFGHDQVDFTVVGSGPNGANPHHEAGDRTIEVGDAVVLDFGGLMHGYGSDTTRTVSVGEPSAELRRVHEMMARGDFRHDTPVRLMRRNLGRDFAGEQFATAQDSDGRFVT